MTATKKNIPAFIPALVVGLLAFALFAPTIPYGFTGYDDNDYVTDNPYVQRGISGESIVWAFTTGHAANWHPITWLSHAFDWQISGKNPWMHHATNVCLHAVNAALLFLLLYRCTGALWPSFFVAALFAVHPLNVQSVAWVAERKNVLSTFFGLLSLLANARYSRTKSAPAYAASLALLACGLMSKPMLVTWPFVMLLMDYWPLQRIAAPIRDFKQVVRQVLKLTPEKVPYFALVFVSSVVTYLVQSRAGATGGEGGIPILYRCLNAIVSYAAYLWQTVWPFGLAAFYPHPFDTIAMWKVVLSLFLLLAITALVLRYGSTKRYLVFGWFFYVGTLVPVIGIVQVGSQSMADRYAYVPLIGFFVLVAWLGSDAKTTLRKPAAIFGALSVVLLSVRTINESPHWRNGITLWEHAVEVTSNNYVAHNNLGTAYKKAKMVDKAVPHFVESLKFRPGHPGALVNLGQLMLDQRNVAEAVSTLEKAVQSSPGHAVAQFTLATAYFAAQRFDKSLEHAKIAQSLSPGDAKIYNLLGILSDVQGRREEAIQYFQTALRINPGLRSAETNLQRVLSK